LDDGLAGGTPNAGARRRWVLVTVDLRDDATRLLLREHRERASELVRSEALQREFHAACHSTASFHRQSCYLGDTVFGFSLSELVVVVLVAVVVMGPKDLPKMLKRLGKFAGKMRRMAADLRAQSGIDDALRSEGLADDIAEIRKLARGELDNVSRLARVDLDESRPKALPLASSVPHEDYARGDDFYVIRDREYPRDGCDAYGAIPDNAIVYTETMPRSPLARDPLYVLGDADAELPPEPEPEPDPQPEPEPQPEPAVAKAEDAAPLIASDSQGAR
jgi:sec-independent protein translocase protein TatB